MILIDTSVFISDFIKEHPHHQPSLELMSRVHKNVFKGVVALHTLAECYSTLTVIPQKAVVTPEMVKNLIKVHIVDHFKLISLTYEDYQLAIDHVVIKNLKSGAIFDALIFQAALKAKARSLITWNTKHFTRFLSGTPDDIKILTPSELLGDT